MILRYPKVCKSRITNSLAGFPGLRSIIQAGSGFQVAFTCLSPAFLVPLTLAAISPKKTLPTFFTLQSRLPVDLLSGQCPLHRRVPPSVGGKGKALKNANVFEVGAFA
jgi:hypothetical protein